MTFLNEYLQHNATGVVSEESASLQIIPATHGLKGDKYDLYLYVEKIHFSVYKAAIGGGGICTIQTNDADHVWTIDVDGIKDVVVDWENEGVKVSDVKDPGLQAVLSGADTQASVSIGIVAHYNRK